MAWLVFIALALFTLSAFTPRRIRPRRWLPSDPEEPPELVQSPVPADAVDVDSDSEREEIGLAECLVAGMLSPERYQRRMAELAAQDDLRMPLVVPPDPGS
jgi:hypothetical protein